jgi:hypothetical protein
VEAAFVRGKQRVTDGVIVREAFRGHAVYLWTKEKRRARFDEGKAQVARAAFAELLAVAGEWDVALGEHVQFFHWYEERRAMAAGNAARRNDICVDC